MKKGMIILEDGFEQVEALGTQDVLYRTHAIDIELVGGSKYEVTSSSNVVIKLNKILKDINPSDYDFIVLPGGKLGTDNLDTNVEVQNLIKEFLENGKHVHAICAAPSILAKRGYLDNKNYTCFPGFQNGKGNYLDTGSVISQNIVTGHSMGYTIEFALNIIKVELGEKYLMAVLPGIYGK